MIMLKNKFYFLAFTLGFAGCFAPPAPQDLAFTKAKVVAISTVPSFVKIWRAGDFDKVIEISFVSNDDIGRQIAAWSNEELVVKWCDSLVQLDGVVSLSPRMNISGVYSGNCRVLPKQIPNQQTENSSCQLEKLNLVSGESKRPFIYTFYIDMVREVSGGTYDFNFTKHLEDICFQLMSHQMVKRGAKSNIVKIPKAVIIDALNETK